MDLKCGRRASILGLAALVAACSSPNPKLYTIAPVDGQVHPGSPPVVLLEQLSLERYLERTQIVRSSENYRLDVLANDWWGEPLGAMLNRVIMADLAQRLPKSTVINDSGAVSAPADVTIGVAIRRMDKDSAGQLVLQAQASVRFKGKTQPMLRSFRFSEAPANAGTAAEVAAISAAVGQLADGLADMVAAGRP